MRFERRGANGGSFLVVEIEETNSFLFRRAAQEEKVPNMAAVTTMKGTRTPFVMPRNLSLQWRKYGVGDVNMVLETMQCSGVCVGVCDHPNSFSTVAAAGALSSVRDATAECSANSKVIIRVRRV